jgi:hypothetical protein
MKVNKILNFLFVFTIIAEAILLVIFPFNFNNATYIHSFPLWLTLPFILLTGLTAAYYKTIIRAMIFFIVNLSPIIIITCIIISKDYLIPKINIIWVIILGIIQVIYLILCILLFKIKSWKWISDPINQLNDKLKRVHIIHQFEKALFLMTISFLGIWIIISEMYDIFNINFEKNTYHAGTLNLFFLISMIVIIISISTILIAIEKELISLLILFYITSCHEIVIIILRLFKYYQHARDTIDPDLFYNMPVYQERFIFGK